jgi:hypothetical protein
MIVALALLIGGAAPLPVACSAASIAMLRHRVDNILAQEPVRRMELADELALEWRAACRNTRATRAAAKEFARLLYVPGARSTAAEVLYTMGSSAWVVRKQAYSAFLKERASIVVRQSQGIPIGGPDLLTDRSLFCLDAKLRQKPMAPTCKSLDNYLQSIDRRLDEQSK